jgi:hypothetical protein
MGQVIVGRGGRGMGQVRTFRLFGFSLLNLWQTKFGTKLTIFVAQLILYVNINLKKKETTVIEGDGLLMGSNINEMAISS